MICLYNKVGEDIPFDVLDKEYVHFKDNGVDFILVNGITSFYDDVWKRAPLYLGMYILKRDSTKWIHPDTHFEGREKFESIKNKWLKSYFMPVYEE